MIGRFIVVEGVRGSGKSSLIKLAKETMEAAGAPVLCLQDFGSDPFCESMRDFFLDPERAFNARIAIAYASKVHLQEKHIVPALKEPRHVIVERWYHSIEAYLLYSNGVGPGMVAQANDLFQIKEPDLTVVCTVDLEVAMERLLKAGRKSNLFEERGEVFMKKVCRYYNSICEGLQADTPEVGLDAILREVGLR